MRRGLAICLLFALLLQGCGKPARPKDEGPLTLNPDGTLGNLRWGMRYAEAVTADSRIRLGTSDDPNADSCEVEFLGKRWTLTLYFGTIGRMDGFVQDGVGRLTCLVLSPLEEGSWEELVEPLEAVLGPRNIRNRYVRPAWDEEGNFTCLSRESIPEWTWAWESAETLGDRLTERELAAAYPYAEDLSALRYGRSLFSVYFRYWDAIGHWVYSYQNIHPEYDPAPPETELPDIVLEGGYAVDAQRIKTLLGSQEDDRPPLSPGADLSTARLHWQGEDYYFTDSVLYELPGRDWWGTEAILVGAVKPSGSREELTGNLDGYVYMQRNLLFPLYFRWRDWDEETDGPEPYLVFSIRKGN